MRVRVNLLNDKSLRRGGNIATADGERFWVSFRYERLPTFCYVCGKIRHDEKHCSVKQDGQQVDRQYGEWLRAGSTNKGGFEHTRSTSSKSQESTDEENIRRRWAEEPSNWRSSVQMVGVGTEALQKCQSQKDTDVTMSDPLVPKNLDKWDSREKEGCDGRQIIEVSKRVEVTRTDLVSELFSSNNDAFSAVGQVNQPNKKTAEVTSPIRPKKNGPSKDKEVLIVSPSNEKKAPGKGQNGPLALILEIIGSEILFRK